MSKTAYGSIMITDSTDGVNAALINLYKQGTTAPSVPSTDLVYNFQNATITGNTGGWSQTTSGFSPTITTWIITAMALSSESTDTILSGEWSVPVQVSDSSTPAQDGLNQATVFIYIRSNTTPQTPANASYTFANGAFTVPSGWSKTIPGANGKPCFVTSAVAIGRGATATLAWVTPTKLAEDGAKGEDGFSPVVTSTSTGVQIEDKDGHITYINNGTNGQTYYTHIRYSSKATPTAASDVSTSPTGKSYMGIQTTTSQTAPAWNNSGWTWVKYVGENGQPGAQGSPGAQGFSVTSVRELYYLTQGSQPSKPTSSTTIVSTDTINVWTTTLPSYVANGKYYVSLETTLSNSTKVWSNVSLDKALTDANYNAYLAMSASQHAEENAWGAMSIASDTQQYFWSLTTDYSTNVKAGTYITKIPNDAFKTNPSSGGANIFMQNAGIWLRNGLDNLVTLQGTGLYLYIPEGTYKGKKGMSLTKDALTFYNIDSTNGVAATLNTNGLRIARGGVYGGSTSDLNNFVFLSTQDFGNSVTVKDHAATDWRLLINNKFGVDKAGNLYASNATIKGQIQADTGYIGESVTIGGKNQSDYLNSNVKIGGRNLLVGTATSVSKATTATTSYVTQSLYYTPNKKRLSELGLKADDYVTLSFDWTITGASTYGNARIEWYGYKDSSNQDAYLAALINPFATFSSSNTSGHVTTTVKLTSTTVNSKRLVCRIDNSNLTLTISNLQLEKGNKATDWQIAPEDINVETITSDSKRFRNLAGYSASSNPYTGYMLIVTPILPNRMCKVHVTGYNYRQASGDSIDVDINFYNYDTSMANCTFVNKGDFDVKEVRVGKVSDSDTRAVIILGTSSTQWYYPKIFVDEALITYSNPPVEYLNGWSITAVGTSYASTYVHITNCIQYNASKVATSYITHINDNGIFISPYSQSPTTSAAGNSVKINGDGLYIYKNGVEQAYFIGTAAAIGTTGQGRVIIKNDGLHVYDYVNSTQRDIAYFGNNARVGLSSGSHFMMNASSLQAFDSTGAKYFEVSASGMTFGTNAAATTTQVSNAKGNFTILWNYSSFTEANNGEAYICKLDALTNTPSDANGTVMWNGTNRTITKQMVNPNTIIPYNIPIYIVCRLSSATATTGTNYMVWYNSDWKYAALPTPTAVGGTWTWDNARDIILGKFVEPSSEAAFVECDTYNPPWSSKQVTSATTTAASAQALANTANTNAGNAAKTATNYLSFDSTNGLRIAQSTQDFTKPYVQVTSNGVKVIYNSTFFSNLTSSGLSIHAGNASNPVATFGSSIIFYEPGTTTQAATINGTGINIKAGSITLGSTFSVTSAGALTAKSGKIGNLNITASSLYTGTHSAYDTAVTGIFINDTYISFGSGAVTYFKNDGSGKLGSWILNTAGTLYADSAAISGSVTKQGRVLLAPSAVNTTNVAIGVGTRTSSSAGYSYPCYMRGDGYFYASNANIQGSITAGSGTIGGWTLGSGSLYKYADSTGATVAAAKAKYYVYIQSSAGTNGGNYAFALRSRTDAQVTANSPVIGSADVQFGIAWSGSMYARNADISGKITASSGKIGGWNISSTALCSATTYAPASGRILLAPAGIKTTSVTGALPIGTYAITASDQFGVTTGGKLYANGAVITGTLTAGANSKIGPWFINDSSISRNSNGTAAGSYNTASNMYFGTSGISLGTAFKVTNAGALSATSGSIGGWSISDSELYASSGSTYTRINPSIFESKTYDSHSDLYTQIKNGGVTMRAGAKGTTSPTLTTIYGPAYDYSTSTASGSVACYKEWSLMRGAGGTLVHRFCGNDEYKNSAAFWYGLPVYMKSSLKVAGTKSREAETKDYGDRLLYSYEMPSPMFGDVGEGKIGEDGIAYITIDPIFSETINLSQYQIFLQKYGLGEIYVLERNFLYFVVKGTPGLSFGWELKAKQKGFEQQRLDKDATFGGPQEAYGDYGFWHLQSIKESRGL